MKPTKHTSFIPMTPDVRPGQRLNEVVGLPDKPDDLNVLIEWKDPHSLQELPQRHTQKTDLCMQCRVGLVSNEQQDRQLLHQSKAMGLGVLGQLAQ